MINLVDEIVDETIHTIAQNRRGESWTVRYGLFGRLVMDLRWRIFDGFEERYND